MENKIIQARFMLATLYFAIFALFHYYCASAEHLETFHHPPITSSLNCTAILEGVNGHTESENHRISYNDEKMLPVDCDSIRKRNYFPSSPASKEEENFPIAYARTIFKDYVYIESELAATYVPQNWYCFAMDAKSDELFHSRIRALASCFPNILVTKKEWVMDSSGHNTTNSFLECMKDLSKPEINWNYVITLQNHDIALKTNEEIVQIFKWFDGANDSEIDEAAEDAYTLDWGFEHLKLLRNAKHIKRGHPRRLQLSKSVVTTSFSRATVEFIVNELDLTITIKQLDSLSYGVDEIAFPTLLTTDAIDIPAGYTHACLDKGITSEHITRFAVWDKEQCDSKYMRHLSCVFGVEDLRVHFVNSPYLFANKVMPEFDIGAISCWHEEIFNRTYLERGKQRLHERIYTQLPLVRYHAEKRKYGFVDISKFDCHKSNAHTIRSSFNFSGSLTVFQLLSTLLFYLMTNTVY
ncbi:core-2/I-Branching enzyme domain-containing protein [Ditylenchus destructor]|uniref:Core-2/I-Branching enzyme domain-containing protein n=1 Tax=Ditylenchus destructor TaxID=166010 RepID=A0AAD4MPC0_9BILA|nr:core-2/I-Branching enzyme domain-containing protein [Ditylenchus destructor]